MSQSNEEYQIQLNKKQLHTWDSLEKEIPEAILRCKNFLKKTPLNRLKSGGKRKKLKGSLKGILQYDINDEARVLYEVDKKERIVYIKYIGHHP